MSEPARDPARSNSPVLAWRPTTAHHRGEWPEGYWKIVIWRGLRLKCPVCGQGKLFATYFRMNDQCDRCGVGFAREHGQWVGSLDINTLLTAIVLMAGAGFGPLWPLATSLAVWCTAAVVLPILTFRFSRGVWTAIVYLTGGVY
ncbi:MAG TPA: DUF983 domain-containing protein [Thermoanaerobaculia bacterium]|jgi:uncharacterized protein (DUF983 family)|nr:DUF983 domain-containing protein [Thermoanaerobaculia bacterium]